MSWDSLDDYDLRNLPAHLVAARRWDDLRETVCDPDYLRVTVSRFGLFELTRILGGVVDSPEVASPLRDRCADLRGVLVDEASFLSSPQYSGLGGPFRNHLDVARVRRGRPAEQPSDTTDADAGQEGWLDLVAWSGHATRRAARFFMPGRRESYVWDIAYSSGPAGVGTTLAVDRKRLRLLGETISYSDNDLEHYYPDYYNWRIWDLRSGALLLDESSHYPGNRPAAFDGPDLVRGPDWADRLPVPPLLADHFAQFKTGFGCAGGPELLFAGQDGRDVFRCVVTDHEGRTVLADVATPPDVVPQVMIKIDDRFVLFGIGNDDHIYRIGLDDESTDSPDIGRPSPLPDDDPVVKLGWSYKNSFESTRGPQPPHELETPAVLGSMTDSSRGLFLVGGLVVQLMTTVVGIWEATTGRWIGEVAASRTTRGGDRLLRGGIAVSPDGRRLISGNGTRICVWNVDELVDERSRSRFGRRRDRPDWVLGGIALPDPVTRLAFLWGGELVAAVTESHELLVLRFHPDSAILARIGMEEEITRMIAEPYGASITCVGRSGAMSTYRFRYLAENSF